ncbi:hypothetical protein [uncultured Cellulomonas sp.]|uniref:hypothetical protein n=1 Tax=uncultured Cellulomonas sp. TaxID=189682 RepID=UPI00261111AD|nr:hypothetical protein [uncultured Cellulomonas sp.]
MSLFEFQIATDRFLVAQRNLLRSSALCPPVLPAAAGVQIVIDRIDVEASHLRRGPETEFAVFLEDHGEVRATDHPATGFPVLLEQHLVLQLTTEADVRAHPNESPRLVAVEVVVTFELSAYALPDECYLRADLGAVDVVVPPLPAPLPASLPPEVLAQIRGFVTDRVRVLAPSGTVPMGLAGLRRGIRFLNAGLALAAGGQTLAVRIQVGGSSWYSYGPWTTFYSGHAVDRRQGNDWSLFVEAGYLTESAKAVLGSSLPRDDALDAYPDCTYRVEGGRAVLDVSALLIFHAVEVQELDLDLTVQAEPHVVLRPAVTAPGTLSVDIDFSRITEVRGFVSTFALSVIRLFGVPAEELILRFAGSAAVEALDDAGLDVEQTSPTTLRVSQAVAVPTVPGSLRSQVTTLLALPDGVALAGSMSTTELTSAVPLIEHTEFAIAAPRVSCGPASMALVAAFYDDHSRFRVLHARAWIGNRGTAPLSLCGPVSLDRPGGAVTPADVSVGDGQPPLDLSVDVAAPGPGYYAAPYPIDLMVRTSGGTRLLRFAALPVVDAARFQALGAELLAAVADCQQLVDPWLGTHVGYNPRWSPRPPEDGSRVEHLWDVVVSGLPAGQAARLVDRDGSAVVTAVSTGDPVHLTTVVAPSGEDRELGIRRLDAPGWSVQSGTVDVTADPGPGGLEVRQTNLVHEGVVRLPGRARGIDVVPVSGAPGVVALLDDRAVAYAVTSPSPAAAERTWPGRFSGALRSAHGLLLYGDDGLAVVDRSGRLTRTVVDVPVRDATVGAEGVVAVTRDRVLVLSPTLEIRDEIQAAGAITAAHARGRLLVGDRHGVMLRGGAVAGAAVTGTVTGVPTGAVTGGSPDGQRLDVQDAAVVSLAHTPFVDPAAVLATLDDGTARVLVTGPDGVREVARYDAVPWFAHAVRLGDRVVRLAEGRDRLELYRVGASVLL